MRNDHILRFTPHVLRLTSYVTMQSYSNVLRLSDSAFALLRDLIHKHTGLFYENGKGDVLADKLSPRATDRGFSSFMDYYYFLKYDEGADEEWERVMDALSVGETFFWREMDQVRALVNVLAPEYFAARNGRGKRGVFRIWSAACASGEEPLTIAMALNEAGWFARMPVEIVASDASPSAIERARRGMYRERSFRALSPALRAKYFVPAEKPGTWQVVPDLHARVQWATANLLAEEEISPFASAHAIFCRNVFIYFSPDAIRQVLRVFFERMPAPGHLFVGVSESLFRLTMDFEWREMGGAFVYVKRE